MTQLNQSAAEKANMYGPNARKIKTFESLQLELNRGRPGWLSNFLRLKGHLVNQSAIRRILNNPSEYPVLNTIINTQEYLFFITVFHGTEPGKDTLDDFRHLVESSLADVFVTKDGELLKQASKTRPFRACHSWKDFKSSLNISAH